jgi:hypothetical protein
VNDEELKMILDQLGSQIGNLTIQLAAANAHSATLQNKLDKLESGVNE